MKQSSTFPPLATKCTIEITNHNRKSLLIHLLYFMMEIMAKSFLFAKEISHGEISSYYAFSKNFYHWGILENIRSFIPTFTFLQHISLRLD